MVLYINPYCCQRCKACEKTFVNILELGYEGVPMAHWIMNDVLLEEILRVKHNCPGHAMRIMTETAFKIMMTKEERCPSHTGSI